jgi:restriction system protein
MDHFGVQTKDIYATNLFPFIKPGPMNSKIPWNRMVEAARESALPQIRIVQPRLVIALGLDCYQALRAAAINSGGPHQLAVAIRNPFPLDGARVYCQAHTGWGFAKRGREQTHKDWTAMADWYRLSST